MTTEQNPAVLDWDGIQIIAGFAFVAAMFVGAGYALYRTSCFLCVNF